MKKRFITNLGLLLLLNLLIKPFWIFGIDRSVQNAAGTESYGVFFSLFSFSLLLNIIPDFGISNFNNREVARNPAIIQSRFTAIILLKLFLSLLYVFICLLSAWFLRYNHFQLHLLLFLCLNQVLASFILFIRSNISGIQYFKTDSVLSILDRTFMIVFCSYLLWGNTSRIDFHIEWFVYAQTLSYLLALIISGITLLAITGNIPLKIHRDEIKTMLIQCLPFALLTVLMSVYYRIDSVMIERMLPDGPHQAGIYAQAFRITDALIQVAVLFASLLLPMFSKMIKNHEHPGQLAVLALQLLLVPSVALVLAAVWHNQALMSRLYTSIQPSSGLILVLLLINFLFIGISYIFGTLLTAAGKLRWLNRIAATMVILNIFLNLLLIPRYHAPGAALASLITQALAAFLQFIIANRYYPVKIQAKKLAAFSFYCLTGILYGYVFYWLVQPWLLAFIVTLFVCIITAFFLNLISPHILGDILQND